MPVDTDAQVVRLVRDHQENGRQVAGLTHAIRKRAQAIKRVAALIEDDIVKVMPVANGFAVPKEGWSVVIGDSPEMLSLDDLSFDALHEELTELAKVTAEAKKLDSCLKTAGLPYLSTEIPNPTPE